MQKARDLSSLGGILLGCCTTNTQCRQAVVEYGRYVSV